MELSKGRSRVCIQNSDKRLERDYRVSKTVSFCCETSQLKITVAYTKDIYYYYFFIPGSAGGLQLCWAVLAGCCRSSGLLRMFLPSSPASTDPGCLLSYMGAREQTFKASVGVMPSNLPFTK